MISKFFAPLWVKLAVGGVLSLLAVIGALWWHAASLSEERDAVLVSLGTEQAHHAVTRQSVETLTREMERLVAEGEVRRARIDDAMERVTIETLPLRQEAKRIETEGLGPDYVDQLREAGI